MLLGDTYIQCTIRHFSHHIFQRTTGWHGRGNTHNLRVLFCQFNDGFTEYVLVFWRLGGIKNFSIDLTGHFIKQSRCMPQGLIFFRQVITFTLNRFDM
ncbi:hypothetical protein D3C87_1528140 [compost metagenome]